MALPLTVKTETVLVHQHHFHPSVHIDQGIGMQIEADPPIESLEARKEDEKMIMPTVRKILGDSKSTTKMNHAVLESHMRI